jgi:hypothetical protein
MNLSSIGLPTLVSLEGGNQCFGESCCFCVQNGGRSLSTLICTAIDGLFYVRRKKKNSAEILSLGNMYVQPEHQTVRGSFPISHVRWVLSGFGGLEDACWPLVPKFAGSNRTKPSDFSGRKNPQHAFLRRGSKAGGPMS